MIGLPHRARFSPLRATDRSKNPVCLVIPRQSGLPTFLGRAFPEAATRRLVAVEEFPHVIPFLAPIGLGNQPVPELRFRKRVSVPKPVAMDDVHVVPDLAADFSSLD